MLKLNLKVAAGCVLAATMCFGAMGCGTGSIDNTTPVEDPDDGGDPALEGEAGADADVDDGTPPE